VVDCLEAQEVTTCFGVPGESYLEVLDALRDSSIRYVSCRQEGGAAYAAEAWGKLTGEPGICFVTRGPGAANASIGVHAARQASTPMILFVGQVGTGHRGREAFQEIDYRSVFRDIAKWVVEIDDADRIPETIARAFVTACSGRPGPVLVALPENMLTATTAASPAPRVRISEPAPSPAAVDESLAILRGAERPLVLVGGGGWSDAGSAALIDFVERNDLPTASVFRFHDRLDNGSPSYVGDAGIGMLPHIRRAILDADVILALGIRFGEIATEAWSLLDVPVPAQTVIHAHPSDRELGKLYQVALPVHAGPNAMAAALSGQVLDHGRWASWRAELRSSYEVSLVAPPQPGDLDMAEVMRVLQAAVPDDVIITNGAGNFSIWPNKFFSFAAAARLLAPQSGSMGYGLPAAIAAKIAHPDRTVVCFAGDGDIQMNIQELGTALQAGAQPIVLVLNNEMYGTIRMHQERQHPGRVSGTDIVNPDFVALAEAYGFHAERVSRTDQFAAAFDRATSSPTGALLELVVPRRMLTPTHELGSD